MSQLATAGNCIRVVVGERSQVCCTRRDGQVDLVVGRAAVTVRQQLIWFGDTRHRYLFYCSIRIHVARKSFNLVIYLHIFTLLFTLQSKFILLFTLLFTLLLTLQFTLLFTLIFTLLFTLQFTLCGINCGESLVGRRK